MSLALISCSKSAQDQDLPTPAGEVSIVDAGAFPPVVMVILPGGTGMCSGTFISPNTVLTASHCAQTSGTYQIQTSFGNFTTSTKYTFGPGQVDDPNDIALLVFSSDIASPSAGQVYDLGNQVSEGETLQLVGFGCDNISTRAGAGTERTGTNVVSSLDTYINFLTPATVDNGGEAILGPGNRAGSCFGDSGGPALAETANGFTIVGVTHAGGTDGSNLLSEYINVATNTDNTGWLSEKNTSLSLGIQGL